MLHSARAAAARVLLLFSCAPAATALGLNEAEFGVLEAREFVVPWKGFLISTDASPQKVENLTRAWQNKPWFLQRFCIVKEDGANFVKVDGYASRVNCNEEVGSCYGGTGLEERQARRFNSHLQALREILRNPNIEYGVIAEDSSLYFAPDFNKRFYHWVSELERTGIVYFACDASTGQNLNDHAAFTVLNAAGDTETVASLTLETSAQGSGGGGSGGGSGGDGLHPSTASFGEKNSTKSQLSSFPDGRAELAFYRDTLDPRLSHAKSSSLAGCINMYAVTKEGAAELISSMIEMEKNPFPTALSNVWMSSDAFSSTGLDVRIYFPPIAGASPALWNDAKDQEKIKSPTDKQEHSEAGTETVIDRTSPVDPVVDAIVEIMIEATSPQQIIDLPTC